MIYPEPCCVPGTIAIIEQMTIPEPDLQLFVIYTYYNKNEEPIFVGSSKDFYNRHMLNLQTYKWATEIEYVGFVFMKNEEDIKDARKYYIRAKQPKYNQRKCRDVEFLPHLQPEDDHLVVYNENLLRRWSEWLSSNDETADYKPIKIKGVEQSIFLPDCNNCIYNQGSDIWR